MINFSLIENYKYKVIKMTNNFIHNNKLQYDKIIKINKINYIII